MRWGLLNFRKGAGTAVLLLVSGPLTWTAAGAEVPCEIEQGVILLKGQINGKGPQKFILDTGATQTVITPPTARALGIKGLPIGGGQEISRVATLSVGEAVLKNLDIYIFDPPQAISLRLDHGINYTGILGYTFLSRFITQIDYRKKVVRFDAGGTGREADEKKPFAATDFRVPFELVDHHIFIKGFVNGKGPLTLLCDTGASEIILTSKTAQEFGFKGIPMMHPPDASCMEGASIRIGDLEAENLPVVLHTPVQARMYGINYQGILGHAFLSRFVVTFDYQARAVTFNRHE